MVIMNDSEIESLKNELDYEKCCRDSASWLNSELEKQIESMRLELRQQEYSWSGDEELRREDDRHRQLEAAVEELRAQLPQWRERIRSAKTCGPDCKLKHDDLNINLDILTPSELVRTVKRFERLKTDLISTLRSKEWRLDSEAKLFVRVSDQRTYLQNELMVCQTHLQRLQRNHQRHCQAIPRKEGDPGSRGPAGLLPPIAAK